MPQMTQVGAMKIADRTEWKKQIRVAMKDADGRVADAAKSLGVSERQLFRWLAEDDMKTIPRAEFGLPRDGKRGRRAKVVVEPEKKIRSRRERRAVA